VLLELVHGVGEEQKSHDGGAFAYTRRVAAVRCQDSGKGGGADQRAEILPIL
jgi:hypothetical protein